MNSQFAVLRRILPVAAACPRHLTWVLGVAALVFAPLLCVAQGYVTSTLAARGVPARPDERVQRVPRTIPSLHLFGPGVLAVDPYGHVFAAGRDGVFKLDAAVTSARKIPARVAGIEGEWRYSGDNGPATLAQMNPRGMTLDAAGNFYLADSANHRIRKVNTSTGVITTVAGTGLRGFSGDGGRADRAQLDEPSGVLLDGAGNLYFEDGTTRGNSRIRRVDAVTGAIRTVAGNGSHGYSGDGGPATSAQFHSLGGLAVDGAGNLYIADNFNNRIRMVSATTGTITTVAGSGKPGHSGDGDQATSADLNNPLDVAVDALGDLYIADSYNYRIRKVTRATGVITTLEEDSTALYGDGQHGFPCSLRLDAAGNLYIADSGISRIRKAPVQNATWSRRPDAFGGAHAFGTPVAGLNFYVTYCNGADWSFTIFTDCTVTTTDPNYPTVVPGAAVAAFNRLVAKYQILFSNKITVNIAVEMSNTGLADSSPTTNNATYADWQLQVTANALGNPGNTYAVIGAGTFPGADPIGLGMVTGQTATFRALGFAVDVPVDSNITFSNTKSFEYNGVSAPNQYDFMDAAAHELDESLGIGSLLTSLNNYAILPADGYNSEDYFRYSATGARSITTNPNAAV